MKLQKAEDIALEHCFTRLTFILHFLYLIDLISLKFSFGLGGWGVSLISNLKEKFILRTFLSRLPHEKILNSICSAYIDNSYCQLPLKKTGILKKK